MSGDKSLPPIYIDQYNYDPLDTIAPLRLPQGNVSDTTENRANAALACIVALTRQVIELRNRVNKLEKK